jgi:hypothetical protein
MPPIQIQSGIFSGFSGSHAPAWEPSERRVRPTHPPTIINQAPQKITSKNGIVQKPPI